MDDDDALEDYQCLNKEWDLLVTLCKFGVINEKYLKAVNFYNFNNVARYSELWINRDFDTKTTNAKTRTTVRS